MQDPSAKIQAKNQLVHILTSECHDCDTSQRGKTERYNQGSHNLTIPATTVRLQ